MTEPSSAAPSPAAQHIIRIALLIGVLSFGAIAWFLRGSDVVPAVGETADVLQLAFFAVVAGTTGALLIFWRRRQAATDARQIATANLVGWALGEAVAMFGAVILLLTGNYLPFVIGAVFMIAAFGVFTIPDSQ